MATIAKIYSWYQLSYEVELEWTRGTSHGVLSVHTDYDEDFGTEHIVVEKFNGGPALEVWRGESLEDAKQAVATYRAGHTLRTTQCATGLSGVQVQEIVPAKVTFDWDN